MFMPTFLASAQTTLPSNEHPMKLNKWTGQISVDGFVVDKIPWTNFSMIRECRGIVDLIYNKPFGPDDALVYGISAGLVLMGIPFNCIGFSDGNKAVASYNGRLPHTAELSFGLTPNGIGLCLRF